MNKEDREIRDKKMIQRYIDGEKILSIAESYGINQHTLRRALRINNIPIIDRPHMIPCTDCSRPVQAKSQARAMLCQNCRDVRQAKKKIRKPKQRTPSGAGRKKYSAPDIVEHLFKDMFTMPKIHFPELMSIVQKCQKYENHL